MGVVYFSIIPTFEPSRYYKCWIVCFYGICILHDSSFSTGWIPQHNFVKDRGDSKRNSIYLYDTGFCKCLPECIVVYPVWFLFANFMGKIPKCKKHYLGRIVDDSFCRDISAFYRKSDGYR